MLRAYNENRTFLAMGIVENIIRLLFGSKADKDRKQIEPYVNKVLEIYPSLSELTNDQLREQMEKNRKDANQQLAAYEQLAKIQIFATEFEKTPKKSIKRYPYTAAMVD